jgi:hypothetical protein
MLLRNFEKDNPLRAGSRQDAHHLRADEPPGTGNENALAGNLWNEDRIDSHLAPRNCGPESRGAMFRRVGKISRHLAKL